ncbi:glycosyltransferase family 2 protein [Vibrio hippocampi]|uniref:Glycosyltransferase GlyG n=1 Tax=Vibrio hippocampi TaxID=654686 RepID=A0ABN8DJL5_9VIBR|nr:glycosyltransferase family A protein [Vibrio hippocampi]CAH0529066.1 Glycosyltransferase GlyG [Vibrio hippocampi]
MIEHKTKPLVSIVMPVYNRDKYVATAIESILAQTFHDYELIVVDDGSTDGSAEIIRGYLDDERIRYVYQENSGSPSLARNSGIALTQGEWVAFLDSDDVWSEDKLAQQIALVNQCEELASPLDLVVGDYSIFSKGKQEQASFFSRFKVWKLLDLEQASHHDAGYSFQRESFLSALYQRGFAMTQAALVRRRLLIEVGCFNSSYIYAEDTDLWLTVAERGRVGVVNTPVFEYHQHEGSITAQPKERFYLDTIAVLTKHRNYAHGVGLKTPKLSQRIVNYRLGYARLLIVNKNYRQSLVEILSSLPHLFTKDNSRALFACFKQLAK